MTKPTTALALTDEDRNSARPHIPGWDDLTDARRDELAAQWLRREARPTRAAMSLESKDGVAYLSPPENQKANYAITPYDTFATRSEDFLSAQLLAIANHLGAHKAADDTNLNGILAFIGGCAAEDEMQAGLATQMALTQHAASKALAHAGSSDTLEQFNGYINAATKLQRTFVLQTEALVKLQRGGVQTVKHVHVNEGGQAVVADTVYTGNGG